jgi:hypothetical protein
MGFCTAGIVIQQADRVSDERILETLDVSDYRSMGPISMEGASFTDYKGVGIGRLDEVALVFSKDIAYTCGFGETELSVQEEQLRELSVNVGVLCFAMDSISDTYGWALFDHGKRVAGRSASDGEALSWSGPVAQYDSSRIPDEDAVVKVIERFSGYRWIDLLFDKQIVGKSFMK